MWDVLCIRRCEGSHAKSLYSTHAVQGGLSCMSGEAKDVMISSPTVIYHDHTSGHMQVQMTSVQDLLSSQ